MNANSHAPDDLAATGLLLFRVGSRHFALPDHCVSAIAPAQPVTPLPFTPDWVDGLVSVGGRILPQANAAALLGEPAAPGGELVTLRADQHECAMRVSEVLARVDADSGSWQPFLQAGGNSYVCGEWQGPTQHALVLDMGRLGALFGANTAPDGEPGLIGNMEAGGAKEAAQTLDCLVFHVGAERYALPLGSVSEIGETPPCTAIPGTPAFIVGIGTLRDAPLLLMSLATLLGRQSREARHLLVLENEQVQVGLLVDAIEGITTFAEHQIRELGEQSGDVCAVLHTDHEQILGLLAVERLLNPQRLGQIRSYAPVRRVQAQAVVEEARPHLQFALNAEAFAIALDSVQRIVSWTSPETVEENEHHIAGLVAIDGEILPVLSRTHFLRGKHDSDVRAEAWLLLNEDDQRWALAVDQAQAIIMLTQSSIEPVGDGNGLVHALATVNGRLLSVVSLSSLRQAAAP